MTGNVDYHQLISVILEVTFIFGAIIGAMLVLFSKRVKETLGQKSGTIMLAMGIAVIIVSILLELFVPRLV